MAKKAKTGPYRKLVRVEILEDMLAYKKGAVAEMHPHLANKLEEKKLAKRSAKALTNEPVAPSAKIATDK